MGWPSLEKTIKSFYTTYTAQLANVKSSPERRKFNFMETPDFKIFTGGGGFWWNWATIMEINDMNF